MKRLKILMPILAIFAMLVAMVGAAVPVAAQAFHGITIQKEALGPSGLPVAHVGETVDVLIRVTNADTAGHAIQINVIGDVIHHDPPVGDEDTGNLLAAPVILAALGDFIDVTHTYLIHDTDVTSPHTDDAYTSGVDQGTGLVVSAAAGASITILRPAIDVTKTVSPDVSKQGDEVIYTITITNTGNTALDRVSVIDSVLGDIAASFPATLAAGASSGPVNFPFVLPGAPDPFPNTVTATYEDLTDFDVSDTAQASVDLVHPSIDITKVANPTSGSVGTMITYTINITNTGDVGLEGISVSDSLLGDLSATFVDTLGIGASDSHDFTRAIQAGDPDPLVNTVTVHANPEGPLTNDITDSALATVDIVIVTPEVGRMTGGGSIAESGVTTHGFELHCDVTQLPNNLEINWDKGHGNVPSKRFHLEELVRAVCTDDPNITPNPPHAGFDTYEGWGNGRYNRVSGATAHWIFTDAGEPGKNDWALVQVWDADGNLVLDVSGYLTSGNHQAHNTR